MPVHLVNALFSTIVLAQDPTPGQGPEFGESSPIALVVVVLLGLALVVLVRSMSKHLKKVPASFDAPPSTTEQPADVPPPAEESQG